MKTCNKCNSERNESEFKKDPRNKSGLTGICTPCSKDWQRQRREARRNGTVPIKVVTEKKCNRCEAVKSSADFYKDAACSDGLSTLCKVCRNGSMTNWRNNNRDRYNKNMRDFRANNPEWAKDTDLRRTHGISLEDYKRMFTDQKGVCAKCGKPQLGIRPLCVDHDHATGKVRQLLCYKCNRDQHVLDNEVALAQSTEYAKRHK